MNRKVLHIITNTAVGGAEMMLYKLLKYDGGVFQHRVVSLRDVDAMGRRIKDLGIDVVGMGLGGARDFDIRLWLQLASRISGYEPDIIQTWMYHSDFVASLLGPLATNAPIVWNVRHSDLAGRGHSRRTRLIAKACASLSWRVPRRIVCNSHHAIQAHVKLGYREDRFQQIPNGFELQHFCANHCHRREVRHELQVSLSAPLVGMIGRYHPSKGHVDFLRAAAEIIKHCPDARFMMVGEQIDDGNSELVKWRRELGLDERVTMLGHRKDVERLLSSLDVLISPSYTESFPNILGEAMACEVPCIATSVGDCEEILGDAGMCRTPGDIEGIARRTVELLRSPPAEIGELRQRLRRRVLERYDIRNVVREYHNLWSDCIDNANNQQMTQLGRAA